MNRNCARNKLWLNYESLTEKSYFTHLTGEAGLVPGMARSPHQLSNEDRLVAPVNQALLSLLVLSNLSKGGGGGDSRFLLLFFYTVM